MRGACGSRGRGRGECRDPPAQRCTAQNASILGVSSGSGGGGRAPNTGPAAGHLGRRLANPGPIAPGAGYRRAGGVAPNQGIRGNRGSASLRKAFGPSPAGGAGGELGQSAGPGGGIGVSPGAPPVRVGTKCMSGQEVPRFPLLPRPSGNPRDLSGRYSPGPHARTERPWPRLGSADRRSPGGIGMLASRGGDRNHWSSRRGAWTRIGAGFLTAAGRLKHGAESEVRVYESADGDATPAEPSSVPGAPGPRAKESPGGAGARKTTS